MVREFEQARNLINKSERISIISHLRPDADSIGANCALKEILKGLGKEIVSICANAIPSDCMFIKGASEFANDFSVNEFDLFIAVDCGHKKRTGFHEKKGFLKGQIPLINIDHHDTNDEFGDVNIVKKDACATCAILLNFLEMGEYKITPSAATALLAGIYFDTGSLMHSNTREESFRAVSKLLRKGGNLGQVIKNLFKTTTIPQMHLLGRIFERTRINDEGVVTSAATENDYKEMGSNPDDVTKAIDFLNSVSGGKFCILLSEDQKGEVKGSVRTRRSDFDVSKVASMLGGGGHRKAAGFGMPGKIKEEGILKITNE